jgi:hypothetical protein
MGGGDLIKGSGTPDWPYPGYPTFFGPWVVVTAGGQVKNVGLVMGAAGVLGALRSELVFGVSCDSTEDGGEEEQRRGQHIGQSIALDLG